jgi:putative PIN family toxin of toxin-antitoxin system
MRVVLDTNVLISMILGGVVGELVDEWDARQFQVVTSTDIVAEYATVLARPKFGLSPDIVEAIVGYIQRNVEFVVPVERIALISDDPKDNMFLECADAGQVEYIVSGDPDLVKLGAFRGIPIITPRAFLDLLKYLKSQAK